MAEREAVTYIGELIGDDVLLVETLLSEISKAPAEVSRHLDLSCRTVEEMEGFLRSHPEFFMVENKRVGSSDRSLESGRSKAVDYFKEVLRLYSEPPKHMQFRGHLCQAEDDVIGFINCFYPGEEFRDFLSKHPDVFVLFEDGSVYLVENESVDYFEDCLNDFGDGLFYMNLLGHVSKAPHHVVDFINRRYPGEKFLEFLEENADVFSVQNGYVYLIPDE